MLCSETIIVLMLSGRLTCPLLQKPPHNTIPSLVTTGLFCMHLMVALTPGVCSLELNSMVSHEFNSPTILCLFTFASVYNVEIQRTLWVIRIVMTVKVS